MPFPTTEEVLKKLEEFISARGTQPTSAELSEFGGWRRVDVADQLLALTANHKVCRQDGYYFLRPAGQAGVAARQKSAETPVAVALMEPPLQEPAVTVEPPATVEPAAIEDPQRAPTGPAWPPPDSELLAAAEEIQSRGGSVTRELCTRYGVKDGPLWRRIGDARERAGLPRRMGRKQSAHAPAPSPRLTERICDDCQDTGYVGGGDSGEICDCAEGARVRSQVHEGTPEIRPALPPVSMAVSMVDPSEGSNTPETTASPTAIRATLILVDGLYGSQISLAAGEWVPDLGDEWPQIVAERPRKHRLWVCTTAFEIGEVQVRLLVPVERGARTQQGVA